LLLFHRKYFITETSLSLISAKGMTSVIERFVISDQIGRNHTNWAIFETCYLLLG